MAKVSIVIPVYNVAPYLRQCLDSVVNQTLRDIEIICVDDGSTDGSADILVEYAAKDPRVKVLTLEHTNAGAARNAGMSVATGEYLGFVDSDDWCDLTLFEKAYAKAKADNADVVIWRHAPYHVVTGKEEASPVLPTEFCRTSALTDYNYAPWNRLMRSALITKHSLSFQSIPRSNDVYFGCMALAYARKVVLLDELLYHYRVGMTTNLQANNSHTPEAVIDAWKYTVKGFDDAGFTEEFRCQLCTASLNSIFYTLQTIDDDHIYASFWKRIRELFVSDAFFCSILPEEIANSRTAAVYAHLKGACSMVEFLVWQQKSNRKIISALWHEKMRLKCDLDDCWKVRRKLWNDRNRLRDRYEQTKVATMTVSIILTTGGNKCTITELSRIKDHIADISADVLEVLPADERRSAKGDYVTFLNVHERYTSRYALENLIMAAREKKAGIAMGSGDGEFNGDVVYFRELLDAHDWNLDKTRCSDAMPVMCRGASIVRAAKKDEIGIPDVGHVFRRIESKMALFALAGKQYFAQMFREICSDDRLELSGMFFTRLADSGLAPEVIGELLYSTGYPYLEAFLSQLARKKGYHNRLRDLYKYGTGSHRFSFHIEKLPVAATAKDGEINHPSLSVVMPVYNVELYLIRAIESVRKQTREDWELICVDDGSTDDSPAILDFYASVDMRIRVFHRENQGVSATRNFALSKVRGRYVAFIDGDDWYEPTMIEETVGIAEDNKLDVCFFDFVCRHYDTLEEIRHFWTFSNLAKKWPIGEVWSADSLKLWWWYGSFCQTIWRTEFLKEHNAVFPLIPLGEDTVLMARLFPFVRRGYVINKAFYNYQRGNPSSAVSRMVDGADSGYLLKENALLDIYRDVYKNACGEATRKKFIGRILSDLCYDGKKDIHVVEWLKTTGLRGLELESVDKQFMINANHLGELRGLMTGVSYEKPEPCVSHRIMRVIEERRRNSTKDLYIVSGQLSSVDDEEIDGWSFFLYLKSRGVPAKFLIQTKHKRCAEFRAEFPEDVVEIKDAGSSCYEVLTRHADLFVRARVVAQEWLMPNPEIAEWLKSLKGLTYLFLQHGVMHFHPVRPIHYHWWRGFNVINFSSEYERDTVMHDIDGHNHGLTGIVCGLARWDGLVDLQDKTRRVLFVMLTFRPTFKNSPERFLRSQYCLGLRKLLSSDNVSRLKNLGVKVVLGIHHGMAQVPNWADGIDPSVEVAQSNQISYWIRHAACLITDSSSVSFDFLYQNKPVIFWIPDRFDPMLSAADREKIRTAEYFQYRLIPPVLSSAEAIDHVEKFAKNGFAPEAEFADKINSFFTYRSNHCQRIYEAVESIWTEGR